MDRVWLLVAEGDQQPHSILISSAIARSSSMIRVVVPPPPASRPLHQFLSGASVLGQTRWMC